MWQESRPTGNPGGPGDDPALPEYDAITAAPDLHRRVLDLVRDRYDMPEELLQALDEEVRHCAHLVMQQMPEEQLSALRKATIRQLREDGEE